MAQSGMARLSLSESGGGRSPNLTSHTPPPPGFDGAAAISGSNISRSGTPKSTSFNDLAAALGTSLAEGMDQGMDQGMDDPPSSVVDCGDGGPLGQDHPRRTFTPDGYARQTRHSVSRMMGSGGGATTGGGFDYLDPERTGHLLIPPANSAYLDTLKAGGGGQAPLQTGSGACFMNSGGSGPNGAGSPPFPSGQPNNDGGNQSYLMAQAASATQDPKPMKFTAAMMANAQLLPQPANTGSGGPSPVLAASTDVQGHAQTRTHPQHLNQELLQRQLQQQHQIMQRSGLGESSDPGANFGQNNPNAIGITVVEPSSTSNSPAPQRHAAMGVGMNSDGLLYLLPNGSNQLSSLARATKETENMAPPQGAAYPGNAAGLAPFGAQHVLAAAAASTGRSSAPPPQSQQPLAGQFVPGGMTTVVLNNAAIRAYTASSLQMRVAELHQQLGVGGARVGVPAAAPVAVPAAPPVAFRAVPTTVPAGAAVVLTQAPTPTPVPRPPSRGGVTTPLDPFLNKQVSRSSTPGSTITDSPNLGACRQLGVQLQSQLPPMPPVNGRIPDQELLEREDSAVVDLTPFLREPFPSRPTKGSSSGGGGGGASSRGLAVLRASDLPVPDVRSTCEAFGALESFRSDFGSTRGVYFATYYDLRNAQLAAGELPRVLNKLRGGGEARVEVRYCVPLNSSSNTDESMLLLSGLPGTVDEGDLGRVLSSFGEIRAVHYQASNAGDDDEDSELSSYLVEFYDIQDARQALLELEQTNPWGYTVKVKVGTRSPTKRKQGKDLIVLMSRWRQGVVSSATPRQEVENMEAKQSGQQTQDSISNTVSPTPSPSPTQPVTEQKLHQQDTMSTGPTVHHQNHQLQQPHQVELQHSTSIGSGSANSTQPFYQQYPQYQLAVGPDGQYSYVLMNTQPQPMAGHGYGHQMVIDPHHQHHPQHQQHVMYATDPQYMVHNAHHLSGINQAVQQQQYHNIQYSMQPGTNYGVSASVPTVLDGLQQPSLPPTQYVRMPSNNVNDSSLSSGSQSPSRAMRASASAARKSSGSIGSGGSSGGGSGGAVSPEDGGNLALHLDKVLSGRDRRSSLMVRNIPNKYTQQMLLSEFAAAGHGSTKMDFFYLPIDFKNGCNRGYAFVNFVDYRDLIPFVERYNGKGWQRFNSDKICDITYARIQGKAAMLKRFENSALMDKDDGYRPKVFVSHGDRKGEVESMPGATATTAETGSSLG
ncbi:hypothetical protein ACHAWF_012000 [Thalassiosira exigua]